MFYLNSATSSWPSKVLDYWYAPLEWYHWPGWPSSMVLLCAPYWNGPSSKCCSCFWQKRLWREGSLVAPRWIFFRRREHPYDPADILSYAQVYGIPTVNGWKKRTKYLFQSYVENKVTERIMIRLRSYTKLLFLNHYFKLIFETTFYEQNYHWYSLLKYPLKILGISNIG